MGFAGSGARSVHCRRDLEPTQPAIFEYVNDMTYGYTTLVANTTHLTMQYVEGGWAHVLDTFTLTKPAA